jgi:hypothetical protein
MGAFDLEHKSFAPFAEFLAIFAVESFSGLNFTSVRQPQSYFQFIP